MESCVDNPDRANAPTRKYCRLSESEIENALTYEDYTPEYMIRFVPGPERLAQLVCVDAAKLADHKWFYYRLGELGLDRLSEDEWREYRGSRSDRRMRPGCVT